MVKLNSIEDVLELARTATPETVGRITEQVYPAVAELALTEVETDQVFAVLKESGKATLTALRQDFTRYLTATEQLETAERESVGTALVKLALENSVETWHDPEGNPWATLRNSGHAEHHPLKTKAIKLYLAYLYYREHGNAPHAQGLQDALTTLTSKAVFEGPEYPTFVRLAEVDGIIYHDLGNERWQVVQVTPKGWSVMEADDIPVRFRRPRSMLALSMPQAGGSLNELARLLNVPLDSRDCKLIVAWLLQALRGTGPYPVLVLSGGQGSGKSTAARMLRLLIDPNVSPLRSLSRNERDLFIAAINGWTLAFDNISGLPQWISDALCKLATGGGVSMRELFSDAEEMLLDAMRPVVLNGITDFVDKQDLVDRALQAYLPPIPKAERKTEKELWAKFDEAKPRILGALYDVMVIGLQRVSSTTLDDLPRLADFAIWASACEAPLGWQKGDFMAAFQAAQDELIKDALEAEPVATALLTFLTLDSPDWTGTASELLAELTTFTYSEKRPPKGWPGAPHVLAGTLKRIAPALLAQGVAVEQLNRSGKKGSKLWSVRTVGDDKRQKRQKESENTEKHPQDSAPAADTEHLTEGLSSRQATVEKAPQKQQNTSTDASDAPIPAASKWVGIEI